MTSIQLLIAGAVLAASVPVLAAGKPAPAANTPTSLTDQTARKYPEAKRADRPVKLYHERWVHDEDHRY